MNRVSGARPLQRAPPDTLGPSGGGSGGRSVGGPLWLDTCTGSAPRAPSGFLVIGPLLNAEVTSWGSPLVSFWET
jgi:hypothetical protein